MRSVDKRAGTPVRSLCILRLSSSTRVPCRNINTLIRFLSFVLIQCKTYPFCDGDSNGRTYLRVIEFHMP